MNTKDRRSIIHVQTIHDFEKGADRFFAWKLVKVLPNYSMKFLKFIIDKAMLEGINSRYHRTELKHCTKFKRVTK